MGEGLRLPVGVRVVLVVGVWVVVVVAETELVLEGVRGAVESGEGVSEGVSTPGCSQRLERPALSIA